MTEHEGDRRAERRDLRQRQIDEDDFAREHLNAEIGVDADQAHRHQEWRPEKCKRLDHRGRRRCQRLDVDVEQRDVVARLRQRADRSGQRHDRRPGLARHESDVAFRLVRLAHDDPHAARTHGLDDAGKMRGARRHAGLRLDKSDKIQAEAARKIRPAVVIGDDRHGFERRQFCLPIPPALHCRRARKACRLASYRRRIGRVDARQCLKDRCGDDLGVLRDRANNADCRCHGHGRRRGRRSSRAAPARRWRTRRRHSRGRRGRSRGLPACTSRRSSHRS